MLYILKKTKKNDRIIVDYKINTIHITDKFFFLSEKFNKFCGQNLGLFFLADLEQKRTNLFIIWSAALAVVANRARKYNPLLVITYNNKTLKNFGSTAYKQVFKQ